MGIREFYEQVTEGMALRDLWHQFKSEAQSSYRLYSADVDWESLDRHSGPRRFLNISLAFASAMLMLLSPARRILLLLSLILFAMGLFRFGDNVPSFTVYGAVGLLLVLALELADRVIMKRDLQIAREIQNWLVPEEAPAMDGMTVAFSTRPANTVGGDFYDAILSKDNSGREKLLLVVADVAGKSVPAALLMATFQATLKALLLVNPTLPELVAGLNRSVLERSQGGRRFTTAFVGEILVAERRLRYINAGHNYPFLRRRRGPTERLTAGGLPLGIQFPVDYELRETALGPGDLLVAFTDGVVEAVNAAGDEFGDERLQQMVDQLPESAGAPICLDFLAQNVDQFAGATRQHDDMSWLVLRVAG